MKAITKEEALEYHRLNGKPGKISTVPTKPLVTQRDLALAYTPGVAIPVLELERDSNLAYEYTDKGNLVAVISNGTAILGLGDRGALASKPVMEGKGVLFKKFADIDVFDIEVNSHDPDEIIKIVAGIAPTFGGINLEDIKSPECFYIERKLQEMLDIPVFHDDQHGTSIILVAGIINALELADKKFSDIKVVFSGAGAAAIACANLLVKVGVPVENVWMTDVKGLVYKGRTEEMFPEKEIYAKGDQPAKLAEVIVGADVFIGLSVGKIVTPEMLKSMAPNPIIFAMANPDPEISYDLALATRPDAIVATGRSDYPNQVNNVLCFPFLFRGALDVYARAINHEMKIAAAYALANLAKQDVPDSVLQAYGLENLKFGREYIIPKPFDPRVLLWEAPAVAQAAMETGVARRKIDLEEYKHQLAYRQGPGEQVYQYILNKAQSVARKKRIVFGEGEEPKIIRAAFHVVEEEIGVPILIGSERVIAEKIKMLGLQFAPLVINPESFRKMPEYERAYLDLRRRKGITPQHAAKALRDPNVLGPMLVKMGDADAFIAGLTYDYPEVIRPALQIHHTRPGVTKAVGVYILIIGTKIYLFTDATVNIDPSAADLAEIAIQASDFAKQIGVEPRVAMLSFANFGSTVHPFTEKVRKATEIVRAARPNLAIDGEMQADTAVVQEIIESRYPFSKVKDANVLVFPSLEAANVSCKLLARLGNALTIGPILLGIGAPIHVLQTGDNVEDIVHIAAVAAMDAISREKGG